VEPTIDDFAIHVSDGHFSHVFNLEVSYGGQESRMYIIRLLPLGTPKVVGFRPNILGSIELLLYCSLMEWNGPACVVCMVQVAQGIWEKVHGCSHR
jgi:hypothetical protein